MHTRRSFLTNVAFSASTVAFGQAAAGAGPDDKRPLFKGGALPTNEPAKSGHYRSPFRFGLGGVALGTAFERVMAKRAAEVMQAAWSAGVRYFDTSPWYGLGLSERRMADFLADKPRDEYVISTKIGRVLTPTQKVPQTMWQAPSPFDFHFDYTADGTRRSIEDSLQRLGMSRLDMVFIHDLSPDHFGEDWTKQFEIAEKGAIPTLTKMRDEGTIKAWGFGVNDVEPCLRALQVADPDVFLLATQYSIVYHQDALNRLFPKCEERGVSIVVGAPYNSGYLAGKNRYNYKPGVPDEIKKKGDRIGAIANEHGTDLRTAALQFCNAPSVVSAVIPGASTGTQVIENALSIAMKIPSDFWQSLKHEKLIAESAATPNDRTSRDGGAPSQAEQEQRADNRHGSARHPQEP